MLSLLAALVVTMFVLVYADAFVDQEALALALRLGVVVLFILWMGNVFGVIDLWIRPW